MQTATATISNTDSSTPCTGVARILFDTGSYRTYITADLAKQLQLTPESSEQLSLTTFGSNNIQHMEAATTKLAIHLLNGERQIITATIVPTITGPVTRTRLPSSLVHEPLQHLPLADTYTGDARSSTIQVLLGNDVYHDLVLPGRRQIAPSLYLLDTRLGWMVSGRLSTTKGCSISNDHPQDPALLSVETAPSTPNAPPLEDFWRMETIGITDSPYDSDDKEAKRLFHESISFRDGRYDVGWPWKAHHDLPDNYQLAKGASARCFAVFAVSRRPSRRTTMSCKSNSKPASSKSHHQKSTALHTDYTTCRITQFSHQEAPPPSCGSSTTAQQRRPTPTTV